MPFNNRFVIALLAGCGLYSRAITTLPSMLAAARRRGASAASGRVGGHLVLLLLLWVVSRSSPPVVRPDAPTVSFKLPVVRQRFRELRNGTSS